MVLRQNAAPRLIDTRSDDRFLDSLVLAFRAVPGEPDRAILVIEGLQTPSGAGAVRGGQRRRLSCRRRRSRRPAETEQKARSREEAERRRAYKIEPPKAAAPPAPAAPPVTATPPPTPAAPTAGCDQSDAGA